MACEDISEDLVAKVVNCQKEFIENNCHPLLKDPRLQSIAKTCSPEELKFENQVSTTREILNGCDSGGRDAFIAFIEGMHDFPGNALSFAANSPDHAKTFVNWLIESNRIQRVRNEIARTYCKVEWEKFESRAPHKSQSKKSEKIPDILKARRKLKFFENCLDNWFDQPTAQQKIDTIIAGLYENISRQWNCFGPAVPGVILCPVLMSLATGAYAEKLAFDAFHGVKALAKENWAHARSGNFRDMRLLPGFSNAQERLDGLKKDPSLNSAEKESIVHQEELLDGANGMVPRGMLLKNGQSEDSIRGFANGVVDSDLGKNQTSWNNLVLNVESSETKRFVASLGGGTQTKASAKFRTILADMVGTSAKKANFFNPNMSPEEISYVLKKVPILQKGFLHEIPGLRRAFDDFNSGRISSQEFQTRVETNLFHNGPQEGFWKALTERMVPEALAKDPEAARLAARFFENTIWDSGKREVFNGIEVVIPRYPTNNTFFGKTHTILDRISQATAVGNKKITYELLEGHKARRKAEGVDVNISEIKISDKAPFFGKNFGEQIQEMALRNGDQTIEQLDALRKSPLRASKKYDAQKKMLDELIDYGEKRIRKRQQFIKNSMKVNPNTGRIDIYYRGKYRRRVSKVILGDETVENSFHDIDDLFKEEIRLNGDPIRGLSDMPLWTYFALPAGFGTVGLINRCRRNFEKLEENVIDDLIQIGRETRRNNSRPTDTDKKGTQ